MAEVELMGYVFVSTAEELLRMQILLKSHKLSLGSLVKMPSKAYSNIVCVCGITVETISFGDDAHNIFCGASFLKAEIQ